ncbi:cell surface glycoprotein CD200 receptor 1-A isoform X2 [Siniperca chuatsi]|uniref:cell surface glycoprotein CD200 receptor 1-A isoform X2 n=1 Tax=Siniperca chuatsi TaxID=119488 RepID=UPI001CE224B2|nr:cell surface glycoprotein CD200 receptor 1-A isoform X2 [Siniperca chuatsi]
MRDMMVIYAAIILFLPEAWSHPVVRNLAFNVGSDVNLTCSDKTWNDTIFVIWTIALKIMKANETCKIAFSNDGQSKDSCNDGKALRNTSSAQSYLHIPNFSNYDVGVYKCESVYTGGNEDYEIHVAITVPPSISAWLERKDNKMVAVCKAERGKPAANISWSHRGNSSSVETLLDSHGFFTVESLLELPEGMDTVNLSCAIRHPYWKREKTLVPEPKKGYIPWLRVVLIVVVIIVFLAGVLFFAQKKLITLRRCQQSDSSPSKSPPTEDVEEVEPYASYVQRVNSIYNSSADLFT